MAIKPRTIGLALLVIAAQWVENNRPSADDKSPDKKSRDPEPTPAQQDRASTKNDAGSDDGHEADSPEEIPAGGWIAIAKRTYAEINNDRVLAVAAGVTFYGLLALFPAVTASVSLFGLIIDPSQISAQLASLSAFLPESALSIVGDQVARIASAPQSTLGFAFLFSLVLALWSATGGTKALIDALNVAYGEQEKRTFLKLNGFALLATLAGIFGLGLMLTVVAVIPAILAFMSLGAVGEWLIWAGRWPVILLVLLSGLAMIYRYGPSRREAKWRWISPGSIFAAVSLLVFSMLFSWYAANFGKFNETYGSLGAIIAFMTWLWLSCVIVLAGAELNSETERQTLKDSTIGTPKPIGKRGANAADDKR